MCMNCGSVIEENLLVSSVEFADSGQGTGQVLGQFVSSTTTKPYSSGGPGYGYQRESREVTIQQGKKRISALASKLGISQDLIDAAHRYFLLAMQRNFIQGRRTKNVIAACLYFSCRRAKAPYLLIDFSEALETNLYSLGSTFLKFSALINRPLPVVDPSLYIHAYASRLEFGNKAHQVGQTALRLVSRLKRDWMQHGRRPSGICGAALIVSARMHGFNRSRTDVVKVLRICEETLRKRLAEFHETPSAKLTMEQFLQLDVPDEANPPSFHAARNAERDRIERRREFVEKRRGVFGLENVGDEENEDGDDVRRSKRKRKAPAHLDSDDSEDDYFSESNEGKGHRFRSKRRAKEMAAEKVQRRRERRKTLRFRVDSDEEELSDVEMNSSEEEAFEHAERLVDVKRSENVDAYTELELELQQALGDIRRERDGADPDDDPTLTDRRAIPQPPRTREEEDARGSDYEEALEDFVDEDEIERKYVLSREEVVKRAAVWDALHGAWVRQRQGPTGVVERKTVKRTAKEKEEMKRLKSLGALSDQKLVPKEQVSFQTRKVNKELTDILWGENDSSDSDE